jgi:hypothetical protein
VLRRTYRWKLTWDNWKQPSILYLTYINNVKFNTSHLYLRIPNSLLSPGFSNKFTYSCRL